MADAYHICATSWHWTLATLFFATRSSFFGSSRYAVILPVIKPCKRHITRRFEMNTKNKQTQFSMAPDVSVSFLLIENLGRTDPHQSQSHSPNVKLRNVVLTIQLATYDQGI
jgi:hypothetical protein